MLNSFFSVFVNAVCCWMLFDVGLYVSYVYFVYDIIIIIIIGSETCLEVEYVVKLVRTEMS